MQAGLVTFWAEPRGVAELYLRRYADGQCGASSIHDAQVLIDCVVPHRDERGYYISPPPQARDHPQWPVVCDSCGYRFKDSDLRQTRSEELYQGGGQSFTLPEAPPGTTYDAWWYPWKGADGLCVMAVLPNGRLWNIDGRASNCTLPKDTIHRCWIRHGNPREAKLTVNKLGVTCAAGSGSILAGDYHGFLTNGRFIP